MTQQENTSDRASAEELVREFLLRHNAPATVIEAFKSVAHDVTKTEQSEAQVSTASAEIALKSVVSAADWWKSNQDSPKSALSHFVRAAEHASDLLTGRSNIPTAEPV